MTVEDDAKAWTQYWQADRLDSCIAGRGEEDEAGLIRLWADFLHSLASPVHIIDLACGNGAVSLRMCGAAKVASIDVSFSAVDIADIDPEQFLSGQNVAAENIEFRGRTDITALPFEKEAYCAAVSQFGFEYADATAAVPELLRVLKPSGQFQFLLHHKASALVAPNVAQIEEIKHLIAGGGLVDVLMMFFQQAAAGQQANFEEVERAGQHITQAYEGRLPRICREIFGAVQQLVDRSDLSFSVREKAVRDMRLRLEREQERMRQLNVASLDEAGVRALIRLLEECGATNVVAEEFRLGSDAALLGWVLRGQKR